MLASMGVSVSMLASGSRGNCALVSSSSTKILVDAGISCREIFKRMKTLGEDPYTLSAILITHEHSDHVQGLALLALKLKIPIYCNRLTGETLQRQLEARLDCRLFSTGAKFEMGDVTVETFTVPHDAQDPVGFLLHTSGGRIGFLTDLGHVTRLVIERVRSANVLLLETNHDIKMLQNCPHRPWSLKQRILSRHGHLSNGAAADAMEQFMSADLRHLYLGHLSRECNQPHLAHAVVQERLSKLGASHVHLHVTAQSHASPTLAL